MAEQNLAFIARYEKERIKLLHEECKEQVNDFYEQGIISPIYAESDLFEYGSGMNTETIIKKLYELLRKGVSLLNKQIVESPFTSLILAAYIGFVLSFLFM